MVAPSRVASKLQQILLLLNIGPKFDKKREISMKSVFLNYLVLPPEITEVERRHVQRINKVALAICLAHVPLFVLVAWLCDTSIVQALGFGIFLVIGPTLAHFTLNNPRMVSLIFGFTSMGLGALLVHLGQGPMQIEMHFHFFAALALLTVWGNPLVIWVATVTVATHHGLFWLLLPKSVFNYEASFWVVVVHAIFVVVEAIAAAFIARNFFDNVIGLEKIVNKKTLELQHRTEDMKTILDNTAQGFMTVAMDGTIEPERSAILSLWFKDLGTKDIFSVFSTINPAFADTLRLGWSSIVEDFMPLEVTISQLPKHLIRDKKTFGFEYRPIMVNGQVAKILLVISDRTAEIERTQSERFQKEMMAIFEKINRDRHGFLEFIEEGNRLMAGLLEEHISEQSEIWRAVHTLKGNASLFGVTSVADQCHVIEDALSESTNDQAIPFLNDLNVAWQGLLERVKLYTVDESRIQITEFDLVDTLARIKNGATREEILTLINSWRYESLKSRMNRFAEQAKALASRLNKSPLNVEVLDIGIRLPQAKWAPFWAAFSHAIRNSVDHGMVSLNEANALPRPPVLKLSSLVKDGCLLVTIEDNGRGIDWESVRKKCNAQKLPSQSEADLIEALFFDGFSMTQKVTSISGRGVGMGSLRQECGRLGGTISIHSEKNQGTRLTFSFPLEAMFEHEEAARAA